jgi:hypothetical protein
VEGAPAKADRAAHAETVSAGKPRRAAGYAAPAAHWGRLSRKKPRRSGAKSREETPQKGQLELTSNSTNTRTFT